VRQPQPSYSDPSYRLLTRSKKGSVKEQAASVNGLVLKEKPDGSKYRIMHVAGSGISKYYMHLSKNLAKDSFNGADKEKFEHFLVFIRPPREGEDEPKWIFINIEQETEFTEEMFHDAVKGDDNFMPQVDALKHIKDTMKIDCIVPHLYCFNSGTYCRVAFDMLDIPYLGSPGSMNHIYASKWMS